jgi:hypothetical protein
MARTIEITFPEGSGPEQALNIHRVRNFAEALSLSLGKLGELPMEQADRATTKIVVSKIAKRDVARCKRLVARLLVKHLMTDDAKIGDAS